MHIDNNNILIMFVIIIIVHIGITIRTTHMMITVVTSSVNSISILIINHY